MQPVGYGKEPFSFNSHKKINTLNQADREDLLRRLANGSLSTVMFNVETVRCVFRTKIIQNLISQLGDEGKLQEKTEAAFFVSSLLFD